VSEIDTAVVDSLKALDPKRPIREVDIASARQWPIAFRATFDKRSRVSIRSYERLGIRRSLQPRPCA